MGTFIQAGQRENRRSSRTRIENTVAKLLDELGISYQRNVSIGRYNVDFLVGEITIIECYGDYWHCNPALYSSEFYHRSLHITAAEKWQRDEVRQTELEKQGYGFHIIWERDAQLDVSSVLYILAVIVNKAESGGMEYDGNN